MDMILEVSNLTCGYGEHMILNNISFSVKTGEICCLLGPNGVGKTTLFKAILGFLKTKEGDIMLDGDSVKKWQKKRLAQTLGYVPQVHDPPFPYQVMEVVLLGRTAHVGWFASPMKKDYEIAEKTLDILGISYLKDKIYTEISGGERQMVLIARALVQEPKFLILDEPTSNLDYGNQVRVLQQVNHLVEQGLGIIMTTHFPDHAFMCPGKVALMQRDRPFMFGTPEEVLNEKNLQSAYGIQVKIAGVLADNGQLLQTCVPVMKEASYHM